MGGILKGNVKCGGKIGIGNVESRKEVIKIFRRVVVSLGVKR